MAALPLPPPPTSNNQVSQEFRDAQFKAGSANSVLAALHTELTQRDQQIGICIQGSVYEWRQMGTIHTFAFANEDYGTLFSAANSPKVISDQQRPLELL